MKHSYIAKSALDIGPCMRIRSGLMLNWSGSVRLFRVSEHWKDVKEQKCMQMSFSLLSLDIPLIVDLNPELYKCADFCSYVIIFILGKEMYKRQKRFIAGKCLKIHRQEQKSSYLKYAIVQANYHR